jgi:PAS domain S-box-containing protein
MGMRTNERSLVLLKRYTIAAVVFWAVVVAVSLVWNLYHLRQSVETMARNEAVASFKRDNAFRQFIASRGGIYVPLDDKTASNPYLNHPERDITTTTGRKLTLMNNAYVFRKIMQEFGGSAAINWRLTSLKPLNVANTPDEWERRSLIELEKNPRMILSFEEIKEEPHLRLLSPLVTIEACLKCHEWQGYRVGEIRGAMGVNLPMKSYLAAQSARVLELTVAHAVFLLIGFIGLGFVYKTAGRNIAERSRAHEELRESEDKFKYVFDHSVIGKSITLPTGQLQVNKAFCEMLGYSPDELRNKKWQDITHPDDIELTQHAIDSIISGGKDSAQFLKRYIHKNGSIVWGDVGTSLRRDPEGKPLYFMTTVNNITELKLTEKDLKRARDYNRRLLEASLDPLVTIGPDGKITDVNAATEEVTGRIRKELIGTDFSDYFTEPEKARAGHEMVFREGYLRDYPLEIRHKDGHIMSVLYNASVYRDESGQVIGVFAAARDVTERTRAEAALEKYRQHLEELVEHRTQEVARSEKRYRSFVDVTSQFAWLTDPNGLIVEDIPALRNFTGQTVEQVRGAGWVDTLHPEDVQRTLEAWDHAVASQSLYETEYRMRRKDGEYRLMLARGVPIMDERGNVLEWVGTCIDITERRKAEEAIRQLNQDLAHRALELEAANKELEAFAYSVSHDLRAPLRAVDGFSRILEEDYGQKIDDEGRRLLGVVRAETALMGKLIDDLLSFSRIGRRELLMNEIDMKDLVRSVCNKLRSANPGRNIEVQIDELPRAFGDQAMVRQALVNLVSNALKFTRPREKAVIEISGGREDGENVYSIKDNGVGFDMQYADKLFGVFQRLHSTEEFEGTGVGLAIVQRIIHRHGGRTWAEGIVGEGATFYFTLPDKTEAIQKGLQ